MASKPTTVPVRVPEGWICWPSLVKIEREVEGTGFLLHFVGGLVVRLDGTYSPIQPLVPLKAVREFPEPAWEC